LVQIKVGIDAITGVVSEMRLAPIECALVVPGIVQFEHESTARMKDLLVTYQYVTAHHIHRVGHAPVELGIRNPQQSVPGVQMQYVASRGQCNALIHCIVDTLISLTLPTIDVRFELPDASYGLVGGSPIYDNDFERLSVMRDYAAQERAQCFGIVVYDDYYGNEWPRGTGYVRPATPSFGNAHKFT
jgi:hypothetical protein